MKTRLGQFASTLLMAVTLTVVLMLAPSAARAAPYAALVMDARTGEVLYSKNADTRLHPASLTKMLTLYIAFEAIERGEIIAGHHGQGLQARGRRTAVASWA